MKRNRMIVFLLFVAFSVVLPQITSGQDGPREYVQAEQMFSQGRYPEAIRLYQEVLSSPSRTISPGVLHTRIADSYFRLADYQHALDAYRRALNDQKAAEQAQTQYWIGFCAMLLGNDSGAVTEFLKIPGQYPASGMWIETAYYWAGRASERLGRKEQAAEFFRMAGGTGTSVQERFAMEKANAIKTGSGARGQGSR